MVSELEKQLEQMEKTVAEILDAVRALYGRERTRRADATIINERLRRFLEEK
jgi:molybdopterin converting factor small subunit